MISHSGIALALSACIIPTVARSSSAQARDTVRARLARPAVAVTHLNTLPAFVVIAPGYMVQAWLFETHRALGGFGYQVTMVGVSALVWTLIIFSLASAVRLLRRLVR